MSLLSIYSRIKPEEIVTTGEVPLVVAAVQGNKWKYTWSLKGIGTCHFYFLILAHVKYMSEPKGK